MSLPSPPALSAELADRLRATFEAAPYARLLGMKALDVKADLVRLRLPYRPELDQPAGVVHGGAIASLADSAAALAILASLGGLVLTPATLDLDVRFLYAARGEDLVATARVRRAGRSIGFVGVDVETESGSLVAHAEATFGLVATEPT